MKKLLFTILLANGLFFAKAQAPKKWTIKECVDYAMKNNISVKQADIQARIAALQYKQAKMYQLPTASFATGVYPQFGRTIDRTTNSFSNTEIINQNFGIQGNIEIFSFHKIKHNIAASEFSAKAALADIEKAANDVGLSVATYFMQVIATHQQIEMANVQINQTILNLDLTNKRVAAGALPELNALQFESQLATDSSGYIAAKTSYDQAVLALKGVLNLDVTEPFDVIIPNVETIPLESLYDLQPEYVYQAAYNNQPSIKANKFRIESIKKAVLSSKASMYPTISGNYSLFSNYTNKALEIVDVVDRFSTAGYTTISGTNYPVFIYNPDYKTKKTSYFNQLNNNFGQSLGLTLSVPIFNYGTARNTFEQNKLNQKNAEITETQIEQKLKLDIYTAYTNAVNALQKFNASKKQVEFSQKTYDLAYKRFEIGLLSSFDLINTQNTLLRSKTQLLSDQFDYTFKMKLLEFYKGQGLKL
jgi:outer membrane protein